MSDKINDSGALPQEQVPPRPAFKFLGCMVVLTLTLTMGVLVAFWMVTSGGFPREPLPFPPLEESADPLNLVELSHLHPAAITGSARAWTLSIESLIKIATETNAISPGSGFRCQTNPDGTITLKVSLGIPESAEDQSFFKRGRYMNFTLTGEIAVEAGSIVKSRIDEYSWGYIYNMQPGEVIEEEAGRKIIERIIEQLIDFGFLPSGFKSFHHDSTGITVELLAL